MFILSCLTFICCDSTNESLKLPNAVYWNPGSCCSNIELLNGEVESSDTGNFSVSILAAVNIKDFDDLNLNHGDSLFIDYIKSEETYPCAIICNAHNGIPVELISIEQN